jgi:F-box and leucine-rich repeat protein 10/11
MAGTRRRSTRSSAAQKPDSSDVVPDKPKTEVTDENAEEEEDRCLACKDDKPTEENGSKEDWVQCDACKQWYHWRCVRNGAEYELDALDKW